MRLAVAFVANAVIGCGGSPDQTGAISKENRSPRITFGQPDVSAHPYTASVVYRTGSAAPWTSGCTGTLIASRVVATAAHCYGYYLDLPRGEVGVTFDPVVGDHPRVVVGRYVIHPEFALDFSTFPMHDSAVVLLEREVNHVQPARLPPAGLLAALTAAGLMDGRKFDSVGYGTIEPTDPNNPEFDFTTVGTRRVATGTFISLSATNLLLSQDPAKGDGGTCIFDSGGPILFAGTNILSSQTQGGDPFCLSTNDTYRLDTADAQGFLKRYVEIPTRVPVCHAGAVTKNSTVKAAIRLLLNGDRIGSCGTREEDDG